MTFDNNRTFGVEIEFIAENNQRTTVEEINNYLLNNNAPIRMYCASYSDCDSSKWRLKTDSSVSGHGYGLEVVSPILEGEEGYNNLMLVLDAINNTGATINRTCGLHVHVGVNNWKIKNFRNLYKRYCKFEEAIDNVMPYSRRRSNNTYCKSTVSCFTYGDNLKNAFDVIDSLKSAREISRHVGTRYTKLNIDSFWKHGTIEFRHHAGTTDKAKISNWLKLVMTMVQAADQVRSVKVKRFDCKNAYMDKISLMLKGLGQVENSLVDAQVKRFFTKRRRELCS